MRISTENQYQLDPEWLREFAYFLDQNGNRKKLKEVKTIFIKAYLENIRDGMNTKDAMQKAKRVAVCFLMLKQ